MSGQGQGHHPPAPGPLSVAFKAGIGRVLRGLQSFFAGRQGRVRAAALGALVLALGIGLARFGARLTAFRERHATGPAWAFPSRVYADGVSLAPGRPLPRVYLERHLAGRGYRHVAGTPDRPGTYAWRADGIEIFLRGFTEARDPAGFGGPGRVRLVIEEGRVAGVARLPAPPGAIPRGAPPPDTTHAPGLEPWPIAILAEPNGARRTWVPLRRIPPVVREAVIASEDRRFSRHFGLDLRSTLRALLVNSRAGEVREGASTITQQLARGLFVGRERSLTRKFKEAFYAIMLEAFLSKDQILEMYLNSVYWGQGDTRAVAGIEEAAQWYFSTSVDSLKLNEAALLAGIIPAPFAYSPFRSPDLALARRNAVLADMAEVGVIDARTAARARARPLWVRRGTTRDDRFPDVMSAADAYLDAELAPGAPRRWGLEIFTTIDLVWQEDAEREVRRVLAGLDPAGDRGGRRAPLQAAFVALDPATGEVRALVGGRNQKPGDFNRATQAKRQTGSSIKPLVYAMALDPTRGGQRFTMRSRLADLPRTFRSGNTIWQPTNSNGSYHPSLALTEALARSANIATANLVEAIGPAEVAKSCQRFGLGKLKPVMSIGLGSNEVTLIDLVSAYGTIDNAGLRLAPRPVRAAVDGRGRDLLPVPQKPVRVLPPGVATLARMLLENVVENGISRPLRWAYGFDRPVGGKTGTTNDNKDTWFCGITPELAAGVWCGYDRPRSVGHAAAGVALPIWAAAMNRMLADWPVTPFVDDPGVVRVVVDARNDSVARSDCPWKIPTAFAAGTVPDTCTADHRADWDAILLARVESDSLAAIGDSLAPPTILRPGAPALVQPPLQAPGAPPRPGPAADSASRRR